MASKFLKQTEFEMPLRPIIPLHCRRAFEREAALRGIAARHLFRDVVDALVRDQLFDAVIGDLYPARERRP